VALKNQLFEQGRFKVWDIQKGTEHEEPLERICIVIRKIIEHVKH